MPDCELKILLDDDRSAFRGGETVSGVVEVRTDAEVRCKGLKVDCHWETHGKGSRTRGEYRETTLFEGTWAAGTQQRYAFSFELPHGPFTYHGHYLNLGWFIRARADIPWALDPKAEMEMRLSENPDVEPQWHNLIISALDLPAELREQVKDPASPDTPPKKATPIGNLVGIGCLLVMALPVLGLIAISIYQGVLLAQGRTDLIGSLIWIGITLVVVGSIARGLLQMLSNRWATKRLGEISFEVEPLTLRRGESLNLRFGCRPTKSTILSSARVRIEAEERVTGGTGTNRKTYAQKVYQHEETIPLNRSLAAGIPFQHDLQLKLPSDAAPSFIARDNRLDWTVSLQLDIPRWPDWADERTILVHP